MTTLATTSGAASTIRQTGLLVDGQFRRSLTGAEFSTINPATEQTITAVAEAGRDDVDQAVRAARRAFDEGPWPAMSARERGRLLHRLADLIEGAQDELAHLETLDNGKPVTLSRYVDLPLVIDCFRYYAGWADKVHGETIPIPGDYLCYTRREPIGVCGQIIPWNFPLLMLAWKWAPALAAGNTLVLKPAEQTPLSALRVGELAMEAGFPPGVINIVNGFGETAGAALVEHPLVDKIAFTGEHTTAQTIMRNASSTLKRLSFELGGKSPNIVFADADIEAAAEGAFSGLFFNQGQCCCAGSRLFVESRIHDEFVDRLVTSAKARRVGDPFARTTEQGPQVDAAQYEKILSYIGRGGAEGATCRAGGSALDGAGYFIEPTIFTDVTDDMAIATDEIFGPVLSVMSFEDVDEVVRRGNETMYGLAAGVWTRDMGKAHDLAHRLRAGTVWLNCYNVLDTAAPFGGFKMSGIGRELGAHGLSQYTELKTVTAHLGG